MKMSTFIKFILLGNEVKLRSVSSDGKEIAPFHLPCEIDIQMLNYWYKDLCLKI